MPKLRAQGFTLIELLVVIGILAVLLAITLVAINPARQFAQTNDTKRSADVNTILNAVGQFTVDNAGQIPGAITTSATEISSTGVDICDELVPTYIAALPVDPLTGDGQHVTDCTAAYNTGYTIMQGDGGRITVFAPDAEVAASISATR